MRSPLLHARLSVKPQPSRLCRRPFSDRYLDTSVRTGEIEEDGILRRKSSATGDIIRNEVQSGIQQLRPVVRQRSGPTPYCCAHLPPAQGLDDMDLVREERVELECPWRKIRRRRLQSRLDHEEQTSESAGIRKRPSHADDVTVGLRRRRRIGGGRDDRTNLWWHPGRGRPSST